VGVFSGLPLWKPLFSKADLAGNPRSIRMKARDSVWFVAVFSLDSQFLLSFQCLSRFPSTICGVGRIQGVYPARLAPATLALCLDCAYVAFQASEGAPSRSLRGVMCAALRVGFSRAARPLVVRLLPVLRFGGPVDGRQIEIRRIVFSEDLSAEEERDG